MPKEAVPVTSMYAEIAIPLPVSDCYTYLLPFELSERARPGVRVRVPFKNREMIGYLIRTAAGEAEGRKLKPVIEILDEQPVVSQKMLALTQWIAREYGTSWGEAIENALPKWVKFGKKAERALRKEIGGEKKEGEVLQPAVLTLTVDQEKALEAIRKSYLETRPKPVLLFGVTGSGKSEIYIRAILDVLKQDKSAICLVPEIALTEQISHFFKKHFGDKLEILHSRLNDTERFLAWKRIEDGSKKVILGPRSAVFAPVPDLGLLIIDEEHEGSYKQETAPRYHARELARWRCEHEKAVLVLGSATPSLESMYQSEKGDLQRIDLMSRIDEKAMPAVTVIDLKDSATRGPRRSSILTPPLVAEIEMNLRKKEGTLLLLNRRGFSTHIHCPRCGSVENCQSCQVSLTYHQEKNSLLCHYCNYQKEASDTCSNCGAQVLRFAGFGTEKVESDTAARWPTARIARLDADSIRKKGEHERILKAFREHKIDILIGTQMIAKGFDFPHVTLVGVILADVGLMLPDFRSSERTFQLLTQVAGRAGRGTKPGRVLVQTFSPDHPSVRFAKEHDFLSFYRYEVPIRFEHQYPPYFRLMNLIVRSPDEKKAYLFARQVRDALKQAILPDESLFAGSTEKAPCQIIGPSPLPFYKLRGHFRWHLMLKFPKNSGVLTKFWETLPKLKKPSGVAMAADVDPLNIL